MSRREKLIAIAALGVVALFGLDRWLITPMLDRRDALLAEEMRLITEAQHANRLLSEKRRAMRRWEDLTREHLLADASQAESAILHAVRDWSRQAGLSLTSVQPDRTGGGEGEYVIALAASANGDMQAVARFLFQLEQADLPVRVERMRLSAAGEGGRLNLDVRLSTIYQPPATTKPTEGGAT